MHEENVNKSPEGILASIFRDIKRKIPSLVFVRGIEHYLNKRNNFVYNIKERSSARGTLKKELEKETMTWKVFVKGLEIIGAESLKVTFEITGQNKHIEKHERFIVFANPTKKETTSDI